MGARSNHEANPLHREGRDVETVRDFLTLEEAAFDVQSYFRLAASRTPEAPPLVDKWILSGYRFGKRLQLVISANEIHPATDHDEKLKIRIANNGLIFCSRHGIFQSAKDEFKETPHLLESFHELGDYTVRPEGNLPGIDQILIRTIGYNLYPQLRGKDTVLCTSFRGLDEPDIQKKIVRRVLAFHKATGTTGSFSESIDLALAQGGITPEFAQELSTIVAELNLQQQAIRLGITPRITEIVFNFRRPETGGVSYCCKP